MGSELVIRRWCDRCRADEGPGFQAEIRLTVGEVDRLLDLCSECFGAVLEPVVEAFADLGQAPPKASRSTSSAPKQAQPTLPNYRAPRSQPDPSERRHCDFCPAQPSTENALKQHIRVRHGLLWSEYQEGKPPTRGVAA